MRYKLRIWIFFLSAIPVVSALAERDIFHYEIIKMASSPLRRKLLTEISVLGAVKHNNNIEGFVQDLSGNVYVIKVGDLIGVTNAKVIHIYSNQIILLEDNHFVVIK
jgi:Tfp pilus assembly protein PilP